jgi:pimeloyl-ACP methyl ester carboxylesterase
VSQPPWLQIDWSAHQRWVSTARGPINTISLQGDDRARAPMLFIHGLGGCWANWLEQLPVLGMQRRVIAIDLPGFGSSPAPSREPITMRFYTETLLALLDSLEIEQVEVVGNSMGGLLACELALAQPARVCSLALISPAGFPLEHVAGRLRLLRPIAPALTAAGVWIAAHAQQVAARPRLREQLIGAVAAHPRRMDARLAAEQLRGMGKLAFLPALESLMGHSLEGRLEAIQAPTLLIWGELDRVLPARFSERFAEQLSDVRKVILPDVGHVAMLEAPERVNALLQEHSEQALIGRALSR